MFSLQILKENAVLPVFLLLWFSQGCSAIDENVFYKLVFTEVVKKPHNCHHLPNPKYFSLL